MRLTKWRILMTALIFCGASLLGAATAWADQIEEAELLEAPTDRDQRWELGLNLRTDFGVRAIRLDAAWAAPSFRVLLVLDPMFWTDGQTSTDVVAFLRTDGFEPFAGWRLNTIPVLEGSRFQHNLLLGTALRFPDFLGGRVSGQWGIEMAMMLTQHGGGLPADGIGFASGRHYLDLVNFGMFARFHYNLPCRGK